MSGLKIFVEINIFENMYILVQKKMSSGIGASIKWENIIYKQSFQIRLKIKNKLYRSRMRSIFFVKFRTTD